MNKRSGLHRTTIALLAMAIIFSVGIRPASADHDVEHRIAQFWARVDAMQPGDFLSSADLGKWALNVIERNPRARVTVTDFRSSTGQMQAGMDRAGLAPVAVTPTAPATGNVEQRIADFWKRVDALLPGDFISAADLGQWALNVIERNPRARISVTDFRSSTGGMQSGMERAGLAPVAAAPTPAPTPRPITVPAVTPAPTVAPIAPPASTTVIRSCIEDEFNGWSPDAVFELCNGQVWVQTSYSYAYRYLYRPNVTITRGTFGWTMYVDGVTGSATVQEVSFLRSCIDGTFVGWEGGTLFPLCNGQIWQQVGYAYRYKYAYRPRVLIYQSPDGRYNMVVAGDFDNPVRVARVR